MKKYDVIVIGSGAAGFSAADWLYRFGIKNICVLTEDVNSGTSRNTGSDKQTYYKLDLCSDAGDSVTKMAADLCAGGSMNGSDALVEAANSTRCFLRLAELGIPFPRDRFGRFAGYRTDHDNTMRATSAGPKTSKYMTEKLQEKVTANGTEILDGYLAVRLIVRDNACRGVLCLTRNGFVSVYAKAVILCTGAPAAIYSRSVYPESQKGATGLAIEAGAELSNFQEWQYGIASVKFRWNLSGSYQQVIPRYFSVSPDGTETEFLSGEDRDGNYSKIFLKGYQWPFDSRKTQGSSEIDMRVFDRLEKGDRVFLDYTKDPAGFDFSALSSEAREYLKKTDALGATPFERLMKLNPKAVALYREHGIDLAKEPLEIGICAQHNNGGIRTDIHSETSVKNLFAVGEAAGKFGVYRPGGSALNDTQVGGLAAAEYLSKTLEGLPSPEETEEKLPMPRTSTSPTLDAISAELTRKMSDCAGIIREEAKLCALLSELNDLKNGFYEKVTVGDSSRVKDFFIFRQTVFSMISLCATCLVSAEKIGSRGGSITLRNGKAVPEDAAYRKFITVTHGETVTFAPADDIPDEQPVFEKLLKNIPEA